MNPTLFAFLGAPRRSSVVKMSGCTGRGRPPAAGDSAARHVALPARENKKTGRRAGNAYAAKAASCEDARAARPYNVLLIFIVFG